jgi:glutamate formiminotransferase/formiminotetrahydrofolate cyclodeaminase
MNQIVECVPNFSEGRNKETIAAIADAIRSTEGCTLLDIDPGASTNRTVYTFVASPEAVVEGAMNAATAARAHIDMTRHSGEHPRFGAMDVCPFIPVANVTMAECARHRRSVWSTPRRDIGCPCISVWACRQSSLPAQPVRCPPW